MEALVRRTTLGVLLGLSFVVSPCLAANHRTENFLVSANSTELATEVGLAAERFRSQLALEWLGYELPRWPLPCPIRVIVGPGVPAGGETSFVFVPRRFGFAGTSRGEVPSHQPADWNMIVRGSRKRVLDSVLPHEVTHTIFATHFGRPLPRWIDEGACTTVEHISERSKQHRLLYQFPDDGSWHRLQ